MIIKKLFLVVLISGVCVPILGMETFKINKLEDLATEENFHKMGNGKGFMINGDNAPFVSVDMQAGRGDWDGEVKGYSRPRWPLFGKPLRMEAGKVKKITFGKQFFPGIISFKLEKKNNFTTYGYAVIGTACCAAIAGMGYWAGLFSKK
jgi:hypothetical protein